MADRQGYGCGIFKSGDLAKRAEAIVQATTFHDDLDMVAKVSRGINLTDLSHTQRVAQRGR